MDDITIKLSEKEFDVLLNYLDRTEKEHIEFQKCEIVEEISNIKTKITNQKIKQEQRKNKEKKNAITFSEDGKSVTLTQRNKEKTYNIGDVIEIDWNKETIYDEEFKDAIYNKKYWQITRFDKRTQEVGIFSYIDMYGENYPEFVDIKVTSVKKLISRAIPISLNYVKNRYDGLCSIYHSGLMYLDFDKCDKEKGIISFYECDTVGKKQEECPHTNYTKDELKDIYVFQYYYRDKYLCI